MSLRERISFGIQTLGQADVAVFEASKKISNMPDDQKQDIAVAGVRSLSALASAGQHNVLSEVFGDEIAVAGFAEIAGLADAQVALLGANAFAATSNLDYQDLEPSADLFESNVYTLHDKSPEQIMRDTQAIKDRISVRNDLAFKMKCLNGEAVQIDLNGKSLEEIEAMNRDMDITAARRREEEESFSDNPIIGSLDTIAGVVTPAVDIFSNTAEKAADFIQENPGLSIAGGLGSAGLMTMLMNGGFENIGLKDLLLLGSVLLIGGSWLHSTKPEKFNELAGQFGIDNFFNEAPKKPMLKFLGDAEELEQSQIMVADSSNDKFKVSAERAGAVTTTDNLHRRDMIESMQQLTASAVPSVEQKPKARSLT